MLYVADTIYILMFFMILTVGDVTLKKVRSCLFKLTVVKRGICAALGDQRVVTALFDYVSVIHEQDTVRVADSRKSVRYYKGSSSLHEQ